MNLNEKMEETLLCIVTVLRTQAAKKYVLGNQKRLELTELVCLEEEQYLALELTAEQREVIDRMVERQGDLEEIDLALTYLAGMLDGVEFLRDNGFLDMIFSTDVSAEE